MPNLSEEKFHNKALFLVTLIIIALAIFGGIIYYQQKMQLQTKKNYLINTISQSSPFQYPHSTMIGAGDTVTDYSTIDTIQNVFSWYENRFEQDNFVLTKNMNNQSLIRLKGQKGAQIIYVFISKDDKQNSLIIAVTHCSISDPYEDRCSYDKENFYKN